MRWPNGPVCVHCGATGSDVATVQHTGKRTREVPEGKKHRPARDGLYYCNACEGQFTVRVGTVLEKSHLSLAMWQWGFRQMCASKKGISAHQIHRTLKISYRSAWFMAHRIREAVRAGSLAPMGGKGKIVESDETFMGTKEGVKKRKGSRGGSHKNIVLTLIERGGEARSFHIGSVTDVITVVNQNIDKESKLSTDDATWLNDAGRGFAGHGRVAHDHEYVRGWVHTNTCEGYFSVFKRGMKGVYQHASEKHLHRYLAEFDFRYSNRIALGVDDTERTDRAVKGIEGKRLTYRRTSGA
jgi:transposase-like protein